MNDDQIRQTMDKVRTVILYAKMMVDQTELTSEELDALQKGFDLQDSVGWVFDPTGYREMLQLGAFEHQKEFMKLIRGIVEFDIRPPGMRPEGDEWEQNIRRVFGPKKDSDND